MAEGPRFSRRRLHALAAGSLAVAAGGLVTSAAAEGPDESAAQTVYAAETGHHMTGPIFNWWLQYGRESAIGWPVTEPLPYGRETLQYFERGALLTYPSAQDPLGVVPLNLGTAWALQQRTADQPHDYEWWFPQSERGVHPAFWESFRESGGAFTFGFPILWGAETTSGFRQAFSRAIWRDSSQRPGPRSGGRLRRPGSQHKHGPRPAVATGADLRSSALAGAAHLRIRPPRGGRSHPANHHVSTPPINRYTGR